MTATNQAYFWGTYSGAELDLVLPFKGKRYGVEVKFNEAPKLTASMRTVTSELELDHLWILYPGSEIYPVEKNISALPLNNLQALRNQLA